MARPNPTLVTKWERELSKYGLSREQFRTSNIQQLVKNGNAEAMAFDPELEPRNMWKNPAQRRGYTMNDFRNINLIPVRYAPRQVPTWALDDRLVRRVLEARYPKIHKPESRDRRDGARAALILYYAYRLMWSDEQIGIELGIARRSVMFYLWRMKDWADKLFSGEFEAYGSKGGYRVYKKTKTGPGKPAPESTARHADLSGVNNNRPMPQPLWMMNLCSRSSETKRAPWCGLLMAR